MRTLHDDDDRLTLHVGEDVARERACGTVEDCGSNDDRSHVRQALLMSWPPCDVGERLERVRLLEGSALIGPVDPDSRGVDDG